MFICMLMYFSQLKSELKSFENAVENGSIYNLSSSLLDELYDEVKHLLIEESWPKFRVVIINIKEAVLVDNDTSANGNE